jgi:hypothetical protein
MPCSSRTTGVQTVEFWMRPDRLVFAEEEGSRYVWVVGKGTTGSQEWAFRMYGTDNDESPPRGRLPPGGAGRGRASSAFRLWCVGLQLSADCRDGVGIDGIVLATGGPRSGQLD